VDIFCDTSRLCRETLLTVTDNLQTFFLGQILYACGSVGRFPLPLKPTEETLWETLKDGSQLLQIRIYCSLFRSTRHFYSWFICADRQTMFDLDEAYIILSVILTRVRKKKQTKKTLYFCALYFWLNAEPPSAPCYIGLLMHIQNMTFSDVLFPSHIIFACLDIGCYLIQLCFGK